MPDINRFDGILPSSGVYSVSVYLYRSAARRGETSDYALDISITGDTGETVKGDFADGLQGGPDYWRVRTNSVLHLRERPSSGARVVIDLRDGAELRNLGCRMAEGRRWCRVATLADPGDEGWVAGDFLVEGSGDTARQRSEADATVPGTDFHATGVVECYDAPGGETQMCDFGVMRDGNGGGIVLVKLPDGRSRAIYYDDGVPTGFDRSEADGDISFEAKQVEDGFMVFIGPASFVIPEAVVQGG
jgi:hypothetical protein